MNIAIPPGLAFADLALEREPVTQRLLFASGPLAEPCRVNALDPASSLADEDLSCSLIGEWYVAHFAAGGPPNPVVVQILADAADAVQHDAGVEL